MNTLQYNDEVILHIKFGKLRERESGRGEEGGRDEGVNKVIA